MSLKAKIDDVFNEPACDKNQGKDAKARKEGLLQAADAGGGGRRLRLRRREDRAPAGHRCRPSHSCPARLRRQQLGQSRRRLLGLRHVAALLHHRPDELDIVMGQGERKLFKAIREIAERYAPPPSSSIRPA